MPSSGYGMESFLDDDILAANNQAKYILDCANRAIANGRFVEWLECFVAAWNQTKNPWQACDAGLIEWDM